MNSAKGPIGSTNDLRARRRSGAVRLRVSTNCDLGRISGGQPGSASDPATPMEPVFRNQRPFYSEGFAPPPLRHWRAAIAVAALSIVFTSLGYLWAADRSDRPRAPPSSVNHSQARPHLDRRWAGKQLPAIVSAAPRDAFPGCSTNG